MRYLEKINHVEKIRSRAPVDRQTRIVTSRSKDSPSSIDPVTFLTNRRQVFDCPKYDDEPLRVIVGGHSIRLKRVGTVTILGRISAAERKRLGWYRGTWLVKCDCGRYENRKSLDLRKPSEKEYVDACSQCRNVWAEVVREEFKRTGKWPAGGGPTHRASQIRGEFSAWPPKI